MISRAEGVRQCLVLTVTRLTLSPSLSQAMRFYDRWYPSFNGEQACLEHNLFTALSSGSITRLWTFQKSTIYRKNGL
jgi:hypothetical protein